MFESFAHLHDLIHSRGACVAVLGPEEDASKRITTATLAGYRAFRVDFDSPPGPVQSSQGEAAGQSPIRDVTLQSPYDMSDTAVGPERIAAADIVLICSKTAVSNTGSPDLRFIRRASEAIALRLRPGQLVLLDKTAYPGMTTHVLQPAFFDKIRLRLGIDYFLACAADLKRSVVVPSLAPCRSKVVGAADPDSLALAATFFQLLGFDVQQSSSSEVAESCGIINDTFRLVWSALFNEMRMLFARMGIDVWEVFKLTNQKTSEVEMLELIHNSSAIVTDSPDFLSWIAPKYGLNVRLLNLARETMRDFPLYLVDRISDALNQYSRPLKDSRILLISLDGMNQVELPGSHLGAKLTCLLREKGAQVVCTHCALAEIVSANPDFPAATIQPLNREVVAAQDALVILAASQAYDWEWVGVSSETDRRHLQCNPKRCPEPGTDCPHLKSETRQGSISNKINGHITLDRQAGICSRLFILFAGDDHSAASPIIVGSQADLALQRRLNPIGEKLPNHASALFTLGHLVASISFVRDLLHDCRRNLKLLASLLCPRSGDLARQFPGNPSQRFLVKRWSENNYTLDACQKLSREHRPVRFSVSNL